MTQTDVVGFCTQCGHRFARASAFCPQCGVATHQFVRDGGQQAETAAKAAGPTSVQPARAVVTDGAAPVTYASPAPAPGATPAPVPAVPRPAAAPSAVLRLEPAPTPQEAPPATVGQRLLANLIDSVLIMIPATVLVVLMFALTSVSDAAVSWSAVGLLTPILYLGLVVLVVAYAIFYNGRGGTVGKRLMGVRVVDAGTGRWIGPGRSFVRWLMLGVEAMPCYLGYLSPFLDKTGQLRGWHDLAAGDRCVAVDREPLSRAWQP